MKQSINKIWTALCALLLFAACAGGQPKTAEPITVVAEETAAPTEEIVVVPAEPVDLNEFVGVYANDNTDFVVIEEIENSYVMSVVLYRLIGLDGGTVSAAADGVVFRSVDPEGNPMTVTFYRDGETCALRVDESTWEYLAPGTVVPGFTPAEERGDWIGEEDLPQKPESHYVFQPKICSVYMEEVFGKDMCDAWYNLVDAVLNGEDTFACKDQYTYDWMMGQFPEHCLPILPELISYAWDREHSVVDGVASFTYLVPPEEAKARIEEFGRQIEDMLNEVFLDDYSDFEKCLALYIYFSDHYEYDWDTYSKMYDEYVDYTSCYRFFQTGIGICHEISSAYSYLLMQAGVQATTMSGTRSYDLSGHQWSYVRINGKDYHIDPTYVLGTGGALRYFMMTDEKREEEDSYDPATFYAVSHYSQDHPHPDYIADDETFSPLWAYDFESFSHETHTVLCPKEQSEYGEWSYEAFDYTGY
jgi:hypothetical protein